MVLGEISCDPGRIPERCEYEDCKGSGVPRYNIENWGTGHDECPKVVSRQYACENLHCVIGLSNHPKYGQPEMIYDVSSCSAEDQRCGEQRLDLLSIVKELWTYRQGLAECCQRK